MISLPTLPKFKKDKNKIESNDSLKQLSTIKDIVKKICAFEGINIETLTNKLKQNQISSIDLPQGPRENMAMEALDFLDDCLYGVKNANELISENSHKTRYQLKSLLILVNQYYNDNVTNSSQIVLNPDNAKIINLEIPKIEKDFNSANELMIKICEIEEIYPEKLFRIISEKIRNSTDGQIDKDQKNTALNLFIRCLQNPEIKKRIFAQEKDFQDKIKILYTLLKNYPLSQKPLSSATPKPRLKDRFKFKVQELKDNFQPIDSLNNVKQKLDDIPTKFKHTILAALTVIGGFTINTEDISKAFQTVESNIPTAKVQLSQIMGSVKDSVTDLAKESKGYFSDMVSTLTDQPTQQEQAKLNLVAKFYQYKNNIKVATVEATRKAKFEDLTKKINYNDLLSYEKEEIKFKVDDSVSELEDNYYKQDFELPKKQIPVKDNFIKFNSDEKQLIEAYINYYNLVPSSGKTNTKPIPDSFSKETFNFLYEEKYGRKILAPNVNLKTGKIESVTFDPEPIRSLTFLLSENYYKPLK